MTDRLDLTEVREAVEASTVLLLKIRMVRNLIDKLDVTKISINLDTGDCNTKPKGTPSQMTININLACDQADNAIATLEELFHAFQLQDGCLVEGWQKGDREFEAKVFEGVIIKDFGQLFERYEENILKTFSGYYNNPSQNTYHSALEKFND